MELTAKVHPAVSYILIFVALIFSLVLRYAMAEAQKTADFWEMQSAEEHISRLN